MKVIWGDAWGASGWAGHKDKYEDHGPLMVVTVGIVLQHDEKGISFSQGMSEQDSILAPAFVPNGMIEEVIEL